MYSTCIFCKADLGTNEVIEEFPVGRRLAFDEARGRLWVVCRRCTRWNLSPLEERFEAIEACERTYREARRRVSSDNIGMAVLGEGLELVRVGAPQRPELAAWRYGRTFLRRRRVHRLETMVSQGVWAGWVMAAPMAPLMVPLSLWELYRNNRIIARAPAVDGSLVPIRVRHAKSLRLKPAAQEEGWYASVAAGRGRQVTLLGGDAFRTAGLLLPHVNVSGADAETVESAVREIERVGTAESFFRDAARRVSREGLWGPESRVSKAPLPLRLALEMAAHEEAEQRALEGELAVLEAAWKEAEEIAAISDSLLIPRPITELLERMRSREHPAAAEKRKP